MGIQLFETSAKDNINVEEMFTAITRMVLRTKKQQKEIQDKNQDNEKVRLGKDKPGSGKKKGKCC